MTRFKRQPETLFARCGMLIYGDEYIGALSRSLGIDERTVQRWAKGLRFVPPDVWERLSRLLLDEEWRIGKTAIEVLEVRQRLREEGRV